MPKKYNVPVKAAPPRFKPIGKYTTVEFREDCAGSCRKCVKKKCIYNIFKDEYRHVAHMAEPEYLYACQSCFRCVQECTRGIFSRVINPEYRSLGDDYWEPDIIHRIWYQAHTGKIPVSGAGYRGPFVGKGFDSMWTDMSEIVRPTRDGIHGREYINTGIELTRRCPRLVFAGDGSISQELPPVFEIPLPVMLGQPEFGVLSENVLQAAVRAAFYLGTMFFINPEYYSANLSSFANCLVPRLDRRNYMEFLENVPGIKMMELEYGDETPKLISGIRALKSGLVISAALPLNAEAASRAAELALCGADTIHFYADSRGREVGSENPRFLKEMIRDVHLRLVGERIRNRVNLIFSGGIAMAEHVAKALICGADGVTIDIPLLIALECRLCGKCENKETCPVRIGDINPDWGKQRIINLVGAWRNQLIEVMGAMGIREARRLRGEVGRSMWFEDLERDSFGPIFGERRVSGPV